MPTNALKMDATNPADNSANKKTNLTLVHNSDFDGDAFEGFFAPVSSDFVDTLIELYSADKQQITEMARYMESIETNTALKYFIEGNLWDEKYGTPRKLENLFSLEGAIGQLNATFWSRAFGLTDVYDYMPQSRRDEWNEQMRYPLGRKASSTTKEIHPLPEFAAETARTTLQDLLHSRAKFFAERIDNLFKGLSRSHVTNQPEGFSKRMIINHAISNGFVDYSTAGLVNDLRCVIAKFMGRDEPKWDATSQVFDFVRQRNGEWRAIDGGALRMRIYNGVGTVHLEVNPEIAYRLNAILASLYPRAIPHKFRKKPVRTKRIKEFELFDKPLPFTVISCLAAMEQDFDIIKDGYRTSRKYIENSLRALRSHDLDKATRKATEDVLRAIGGVFDGKRWMFDYDTKSVIGEIICNGSIPDEQSHQFFPTPEELATEVVRIANVGAEPGMRWLEPHAGIGGLADHVPSDAYLLCNEISELHCKILEAKGYDTQESSLRTVKNMDFLVLAKEYAGKPFDRIVANPPFSEQRWQRHIEAAVPLLAENGRLVAILPASASNKVLVEGYEHTYSPVFKNRFTGASVSVVIVTIEKKNRGDHA